MRRENEHCGCAMAYNGWRMGCTTKVQHGQHADPRPGMLECMCMVIEVQHGAQNSISSSSALHWVHLRVEPHTERPHAFPSQLFGHLATRQLGSTCLHPESIQLQYS